MSYLQDPELFELGTAQSTWARGWVGSELQSTSGLCLLPFMTGPSSHQAKMWGQVCSKTWLHLTRCRRLMFNKGSPDWWTFSRWINSFSFCKQKQRELHSSVIHMGVYLSICLSIYLSIRLCIYPSIHLSWPYWSGYQLTNKRTNTGSRATFTQ
jgi:hypothetical protein